MPSRSSVLELRTTLSFGCWRRHDHLAKPSEDDLPMFSADELQFLAYAILTLNVMMQSGIAYIMRISDVVLMAGPVGCRSGFRYL